MAGEIGATTPAKSNKGGLKTGYTGDPSRKRGLELGFDQGLKAGKQDKEQNKKPDPGACEDYQKPEKFFRHEYGSQTAFTSGFKSGFVGGYQSAFGKKVPLKSTGDGLTTATTSPKTGVPKTSKPKEGSSANTSSDAL